MPERRLQNRRARYAITPAAASRYRAMGSPGDWFDDEVLCDLLGVPYLIAMPPGEMEALGAALAAAAEALGDA